MDRSTQQTLPSIGTAIAGGFFAGLYYHDNDIKALIVAPKSEGERDSAEWNGNYKNISGAKSFVDGLANTTAMAEAGSELAIWARDLCIGGFDDWHIGAQDQVELLYRAFKPTTDENSQWNRSGINVSALIATRPYTPEFPAQTTLAAFQLGGEEAFEEAAYWTSTQHASTSSDAWYQDFEYGHQGHNGKYNELRARAVRSISLDQFNDLLISLAGENANV